MIRITKTFIRPSTNVVWFHETPAGVSWSDYRATKTDILSNPANSFSQDGLTWTHAITWISREAFDARISDATYNAGLEARKAYNTANGIFESDTQIVNL
jgi:hypothetical protein